MKFSSSSLLVLLASLNGVAQAFVAAPVVGHGDVSTTTLFAARPKIAGTESSLTFSAVVVVL